MKQHYDYSLSASKLNQFNEDPLMFWLVEKDILAKPDEIFAGITKAMDKKTKDHFDQFRGSLPPQLVGKVPGVLDPDLVKRGWRNWQSFQIFITVNGKRVRVLGMLDDALVDDSTGHPVFTPLDNKSKESRPKDNGAKWYQRQMDVYVLILRELGYAVSGKAVLNYMWPTEIGADPSAETTTLTKPSMVNVWFDSEVCILEANPDRAIEVITQAIECLESDNPPMATDRKLSGFGDSFHWWKAEREQRSPDSVVTPQPVVVVSP